MSWTPNCIDCNKKISRYSTRCLSCSNTYHKKGKKNHKLIKIGNKNGAWKGNDVGYGTLHQWVQRWKGKAKKCQECSRTPVEWANIDHEYKRKLDDYISLCDKCHRAYDIEKGLRKYKGPFTKGHKINSRGGK